MSDPVTKVLSIKDSAFASGSRKKFRKRRHRNKYRNSSLRKKRLRKFHSANKTGSYKSNIFKPSRIGEKIMSNWYWSNYKKAVEWQNKHKIAHWKSCALALLEENRYLLNIINNMQPSMVPEVSVTQQNLENGLKLRKKYMKKEASDFNNFRSPYHQKDTNFDDDDDNNNDDDDDDDDDADDDNNNNDDDADDDDNSNVIEEDDEIEFEMSEEMMEFFRQSYEHKMDLKKLQEKELENNTEQEVKQIQNNKINRSTEMNFLYGGGASMIIGMETAVQLSFDKYCDTKSPKYWPNIPFKL